MENLKLQIAELLTTEATVIVEGKKDKKAVEMLGAEDVVLLNKPIHQTIDEVSERNKPVIILTDLDKEGKALYGKLAQGLQNRGVKIDNRLRNLLFKDTKLRQIEGLTTYLKGQDI